MICSDDFLAPCQPKTGSTTRREGFVPILGAQKALIYDGVSYRGHAPLSQIPAEALGGRLVVATVRNPFDWLVSLYMHLRLSPTWAGPRRRRARRSPSPGQVREDLRTWGQGSSEWEDVLYGWTHPWELPRVVSAPHLLYNPGGPSLRDWGRLRYGLWSHSSLLFYGGAHVYVDCAQQNQGWAELFPEHAEALLACPPINSSGRRHTSEWFTAEQEGWVREADGHLMARLGYGEPGGFARHSVQEIALP